MFDSSEKAVTKRRFGISTHLYHDQRLERQHLAEVASFGFEAVEVFATRTHFDYHDPAAIVNLERWLHETGLALHAIHAPCVESLVNGQWGPAITNATTDEAVRTRAVREAQAALEIARRIPTSFLVVHLGVPTSQRPDATDNNRDAARRSLEQIYGFASPLGVGLAAEVIPNELSAVASLVALLEDELDLPGAGICMDFGHAHLAGDVLDALEVTSGHLVTTHVHDNRGRTDDHLAPFDGSIDWPAALTAVQKIGYEGALLFELANTSHSREVLEKARRVRQRFEQLLGS